MQHTSSPTALTASLVILDARMTQEGRQKAETSMSALTTLLGTDRESELCGRSISVRVSCPQTSFCRRRACLTFEHRLRKRKLLLC